MQKSLCGNTVLIVDDEQNQLNMAAMMLHHFGYNVYTAMNAEQAAEIVKKERDISYVITDLNIAPGDTAFDIIDMAERYTPAARLFVLTGDRGSELEQRVRTRVGEGNVLYKPVRFQKVHGLLQDPGRGYCSAKAGCISTR